MLRAVLDKIYQEEEFNNTENFLMKYYFNKTRERLYPFRNELDEHYDLSFCEKFFDKENGEFAKNLSQEDKNFLIKMWELIDYEKFIEFEENRFKQNQNIDFIDCLHSYKENNINEIEKSITDIGGNAFGDQIKIDITNTLKDKIETLKNKFLEIHDEINSAFNFKLANFIDDFSHTLYMQERQLKLMNWDDCSLEEKSHRIMKYFQYDVFGMPIDKNAQQVYENKFVIFNEHLNETFVSKAEKELKDLGYEVAIFKDEKESQRENEDYFIFAYARNKEDLKGAFEHFTENNETFQNSNKNLKKLKY